MTSRTNELWWEMEVISVLLSECRKAKGMTQTQLAEHLGVTQSAVGNWEVGLRIPPLITIRKISRIFDIPISELEFLGEIRDVD